MRRAVLAAVLAAELAVGAGVAAGAGPARLPAAEGPAVRLVSLGGQRTDALLDRVRPEIGPAEEKVLRFWGPDWDREVEVVAAGSDEEFLRYARLDPQQPWADIAAVAVADSVDPTRRHVFGQRIVLAPGASAMSDRALRIVLAHELFHLAARADTAFDAPRWLTEGVADFVARAPVPLPPGAAANPALPTDAELDAPGPQRSAGYDRAWWFARFVAEGYGGDGLRRLYIRSCGPGHTGFAASVQQALGLDLPTLQLRWAGWLSGHVPPASVSGDDANPSGHQ